jgi:hypothetical protein
MLVSLHTLGQSNAQHAGTTVLHETGHHRRKSAEQVLDGLLEITLDVDDPFISAHGQILSLDGSLHYLLSGVGLTSKGSTDGSNSCDMMGTWSVCPDLIHHPVLRQWWRS